VNGYRKPLLGANVSHAKPGLIGEDTACLASCGFLLSSFRRSADENLPILIRRVSEGRVGLAVRPSLTGVLRYSHLPLALFRAQNKYVTYYEAQNVPLIFRTMLSFFAPMVEIAMAQANLNRISSLDE